VGFRKEQQGSRNSKARRNAARLTLDHSSAGDLVFPYIKMSTCIMHCVLSTLHDENLSKG
jgi:hypothetical protein